MRRFDITIGIPVESGLKHKLYRFNSVEDLVEYLEQLKQMQTVVFMKGTNYKPQELFVIEYGNGKVKEFTDFNKAIIFYLNPKTQNPQLFVSRILEKDYYYED